MTARLVAIGLATLLAAGCATRPTTAPTHEWPKPCDDCLAGVSNFTKVTDQLWRGAQPDRHDPDVFRKLAKSGVKSVINLRHDHDDFPKLQETGLEYLWLPMRAWHPEKEDMVLLLSALRRAAADPKHWPVLVHCAEGKDRTGYVIAAYRIVEQGWSADDAIQEMFDFHYNPLWSGNPGFLRRLEEEREEIRARVRRAP